VACGSKQSFAALLEMGADLSQLSSNGCPVLYCCAFDKELQLFDTVCKLRPTDLKAADSRGWTIWHYAAAFCNQTLLQALHRLDQEGCNPGSLIKASDGSTALHVFGHINTDEHPLPGDFYTNLSERTNQKSRHLQCFSFLMNLYEESGILKHDSSTALHEWASGPLSRL
jgi:hypothetical protein